MKFMISLSPDVVGGVAIHSITGHFQRENPDATEDELREIFVAEKTAGGTLPAWYKFVEPSDLPGSNVNGSIEVQFFESWELDGSENVVVNMTKARAIHLTKIRRVRNAELVKEDVNMLRAIEAEDTSAQSTVATKKQVLRDIPATFDITTDVDTPEQLHAKWPSELPARE